MEVRTYGGLAYGHVQWKHVRTEVRTEVRTIEVLVYGMIEVLAHGARMTYRRLPMGERVASSEHRTSSEYQ